jgi:ABC-2 type transport system ATP-binding protein
MTMDLQVLVPPRTFIILLDNRYRKEGLVGDALELDSVSKTFRIRSSRRRQQAVRGLCLKVKKGGVFGLLGPNGAGKTTTLKVLLGLVNPDEGTGRVLGAPLGDASARRRLGFLPEQPYFYGFLTAEKALDLYGRFFGINRAERKRLSAEMLEVVGLRPGSHLTLDKYSRGMLQRFGIAQALLGDPELLILDEPSSGLDPVGQKEVRDLLLELNGRGKTVFLSSHQLSEVENICDSVSIIVGGRTATEGRLQDLLRVEGKTAVRFSGTVPGADEELGRMSESLRRDEDQLTLVIGEDPFPVIEAANRLGLALVSVVPYKRSLEDLFIETVREGGK